jgi:hypothetical protein
LAAEVKAANGYPVLRPASKSSIGGRYFAGSERRGQLRAEKPIRRRRDVRRARRRAVGGAALGSAC